MVWRPTQEAARSVATVKCFACGGPHFQYDRVTQRWACPIKLSRARDKLPAPASHHSLISIYREPSVPAHAQISSRAQAATHSQGAVAAVNHSNADKERERDSDKGEKDNVRREIVRLRSKLEATEQRVEALQQQIKQLERKQEEAKKKNAEKEIKERELVSASPAATATSNSPPIRPSTGGVVISEQQKEREKKEIKEAERKESEEKKKKEIKERELVSASPAVVATSNSPPIWLSTGGAVISEQQKEKESTEIKEKERKAKKKEIKERELVSASPAVVATSNSPPIRPFTGGAVISEQQEQQSGEGKEEKRKESKEREQKVIKGRCIVTSGQHEQRADHSLSSGQQYLLSGVSADQRERLITAFADIDKHYAEAEADAEAKLDREIDDWTQETAELAAARRSKRLRQKARRKQQSGESKEKESKEKENKEKESKEKEKKEIKER